MTMETKHFALDEFEVKEDGDARRITGFGSTFGNTDSYGDIVLPGAFAKSIAARKPAMLWQHRTDMLPGVWDVIEEQKKGLYLEGTFAPTALGTEAYTLSKMGAVTGLSIGFSTKKFEIDPKKNTRQLIEVELYEVSLVTFPANEKATITAVKSLEGVPFDALHEHKRMVEAALRDAGASDQLATYVASLIPKPAPRDAGGEALIASITNAMNSLKGITA
jgi:uncharacterized protein